jgi:hypothetical protein
MGAYIYKLSKRVFTATGPEGPVEIGTALYAYKPYWSDLDGANQKMARHSGCTAARKYWQDRQRPRLVIFESMAKNLRWAAKRGYSSVTVFICPDVTMVDDNLVPAGTLDLHTRTFVPEKK